MWALKVIFDCVSLGWLFLTMNAECNNPKTPSSNINIFFEKDWFYRKKVVIYQPYLMGKMLSEIYGSYFKCTKPVCFTQLSSSNIQNF